MSNFIPGAGVGVIAYSCSRETYNTYDFSAGGGGVSVSPVCPVCLFVCLNLLFTSRQKISVMLGLVFLG